MRRMLAASRGTFSLSFAVCNSPALRDYLIDRLRESVPNLAVVAIPAGTTDPWEVVHSQSDGTGPDALFVTDLERVVPSGGEDITALRSLNASRELWERRFLCPVVFWLPEYAAAALSIEARDFWRYRSHRFEFVSPYATASAGAAEYLSGGTSGILNLSRDEKEFRIAELEQRLADAGNPPDPALLRGVLNWLNELGVLNKSLGRLDAAERYFRNYLCLAQSMSSDVDVAIACGNLGMVLRTRGDLAGAEAMYRRALQIDERQGRPKGIASDYGSLGIVLQIRGDLEGAEAMHRKALQIDERVGWLDGMAAQYGSLGIVLQIRGDLEGAEAMYRRALDINERLGRLEGMASQYGNLGLILYSRGDLEEAEAMCRKALAIEERLGRREGMANAYGNLGSVLEARGDLEGARQFWTTARDLFATLGAKHMAERVQRLIDGLPA